jgi:hypothetical protein
VSGINKLRQKPALLENLRVLAAEKAVLRDQRALATAPCLRIIKSRASRIARAQGLRELPSTLPQKATARDFERFYEKVIKVKADVAALLNNLFSDVSLDVRW